MVINPDPKRKREESVANLDQRIRCEYRLDKSWEIVFGTFTILQDNWVKNIVINFQSRIFSPAHSYWNGLIAFFA